MKDISEPSKEPPCQHRGHPNTEQRPLCLSPRERSIARGSPQVEGSGSLCRHGSKHTITHGSRAQCDSAHPRHSTERARAQRSHSGLGPGPCPPLIPRKPRGHAWELRRGAGNGGARPEESGLECSSLGEDGERGNAAPWSCAFRNNALRSSPGSYGLLEMHTNSCL